MGHSFWNEYIRLVCISAGGRTLPGMRGWLKLPMDNDRVLTKGAPLGGWRREIVSDLIGQMTMRLLDLEATTNGPNQLKVDLVWSAGTLGDAGWANELHPKPSGFNQLANDCWSGLARQALGLP